MTFKGKLHPAQAGELMHVINNALSYVLIRLGKVHDEKLAAEIEERVLAIADYVKKLADQEDWNSSRFDNPLKQVTEANLDLQDRLLLSIMSSDIAEGAISAKK